MPPTPRSTSATRAGASQGERRSGRWLWVLLVVGATEAQTPVPSEAAPRHEPRPAASAFRAPGGADPIAANAACAGCHTEIAEEHARSEHHTAYTDSAFQRALAIEPLPFCRGCHAQEADPARPPPADLADLGVACTSCHGDPGAPRSARPSPFAPHAVQVDPALGDDAGCGSCHQFAFPDEGRRHTTQLFQRTIDEHAASPDAKAPCASCHMPFVRGHRAHGFASSRDPAAIRRAVAIDIDRDPARPSEVQVVLTAQGGGHRFPTGDLFRRVTIEAEVVGPDASSLGQATVFLARRFRDVPQGLTSVREEVEDTRLAPGERRLVRVSLGEVAVDHPIHVRVLYQRAQGGGPFAAAHVGSEAVLAEATLPSGARVDLAGR